MFYLTTPENRTSRLGTRCREVYGYGNMKLKLARHRIVGGLSDVTHPAKNRFLGSRQDCWNYGTSDE